MGQEVSRFLTACLCFFICFFVLGGVLLWIKGSDKNKQQKHTKFSSARVGRCCPETLFSIQATRLPSFLLCTPHSLAPCPTTFLSPSTPAACMHPPTPRPYQSCPFFLADGFKHCWKVYSSGQAEPARQYHNISFTSKKQQGRQLQYFSLILPFPQPASKSSPSRCMFISLWNTRDAPGSCWRSLVRCFNKKKIKKSFFQCAATLQ